ncbi:CHAD domain-containing protein [Leptolyngbya sp. FACHB-711]|uniref:CHAD domain-containing protein n=1 Tax=Leptolyngbya sp. FACHB-711 TaxID=2692813 RepID=UPI001683F5DA|nr:CHAD domain-containing protein [Leptolyngbya sp. FACHB-711]MBD1848449.1 CHAD domain-containing protein [Cyanobacteria bacterium FACHB-502]MBD2024155.1 CHAD domain-containing protein [Leptolyngbya sp. FACHB-711]
MFEAQQGESANSIAQLPQPLEAYAHQVIAEQYRRIVKQEKKVLADKNPEALHQMRVGTRRLRTALQVFDGAIELPKAGSALLQYPSLYSNEDKMVAKAERLADRSLQE